MSWLFHVAFLDRFAPWHWTVCQQLWQFIVRWVCRQCQNLGRSNVGDQRTSFSQIWYQISHQNLHILWWTQIHNGFNCEFCSRILALSSHSVRPSVCCPQAWHPILSPLYDLLYHTNQIFSESLWHPLSTDPLVNCPTIWSLLFIFGFLCWSSIYFPSQIQRNIV